MAEYDNTNSGALFQNEKKVKSSHPDFRGSCTIKTPDGELVEYWVSAWEKDGRKGPFVSLSFTPKDEEKKSSGDRPAQKSSGLFSKKRVDDEPAPKAKKIIEEDLNDEVPF